MSISSARLREKIQSAGELHGLVGAMKALAASSIGQYERSVDALGDFSHGLELALGVCLREGGFSGNAPPLPSKALRGDACAVVFGSDQGLVGQFNEIVTAFAAKALADHRGNVEIWAVGDRAQDRLGEAGLRSAQAFTVPASVKAISPLVGRILDAVEASHGGDGARELWLFHNRPSSASKFGPVAQRLLPLDEAWARRIAAIPWPTAEPAQALGPAEAVLRQMIRQHLFVSLFRACAESLASENASRLAAMQRADKNITGILKSLNVSFHRQRQSGIDEELFDVISGFEALNGPGRGGDA